MQAAFRLDYSCNTALIKVTDDILEVPDREELTILSIGCDHNEEKFSTEYCKIHSRSFTHLSVNIAYLKFCKCLFYADDTQIYIPSRPNEALGSVDKQNIVRQSYVNLQTNFYS